MVTETATGRALEFARIYYNRKLQDHWIRRLAAIIIDAVLIGVATLVLEIIIFLASAMSSNMSFSVPWWSINSLVFPFF